MTERVEVPGYRVIRKLGEGGMATVYLALQESLDREVALKVMSPVLAANPSFCDQFMKEGRIAAKLTHPHLMTVHDIGCENGIYYLASEYLPAGTLRDRIDRITPAEALEVARDIASGLAYAHEKGFVHRDVKPGNIMFRANGTAVLADFGIAKAIKSVSAATMAGNAIGTPDYMSPEQAQASLIDGRSDLYSLGAVLYECLARRKPYQANDPYAVALMHVTEPVPQLPEPVAWLQPLIDGLMAKNPDQRFATGEAFLAAVDRILAEHPELTAPTTKDQRISRKRPALPSMVVAPPGVTPPPRSSRRVWIVGGALAAGLAVVVGGWLLAQRSPMRGVPAAAPVATPALPPPPVADDASVSAALAKLDLPTLIARGEEYLAYGQKNFGEKLDFPPGDNAIDLFREALRRDPGNERASRGLATVAAFYEKAARGALRNGLYTATDEFIQKGLRADPNQAGLLQLKTELAKAERGG
jgi:serine/threonine protein kinase